MTDKPKKTMSADEFVALNREVAERAKQAKPPSLWQRFKVKLFGGEGTVRDLFR
jgi:hypothetical protein